MTEQVEDKLNLYKQALYDACRASGGTDRLFSQDDLLDMDAIPLRDLATLARVVNRLCEEKLFVSCVDDGNLAWRWRPLVEAEKYNQCDNQEQALVYGVIDDAGRDGIWSQTIPKKLKMHDNVFKTAIKHLLQKKLIATFKSVQHPTKKMFIKASLRPSEKATGGPFFTDQTLDEAFVDALLAVIYDYIKQKSTQRQFVLDTGRKQPQKVITGQNPQKRTSDQMLGVEEVAAVPKKEILVPMPAGYKLFPTIPEITKVLAKSRITEAVLGEDDVQNLVNVLKWEKLVDPVTVGDRNGWKITRPTKQGVDSWAARLQSGDIEDCGPSRYSNAYSDIPCGKCPVFDLCEVDAPVGPHNCEYFQKWLGND